MRRLKAKTKVKATSIVDLQYADDCAIAAHTGADLQNNLDAFSQAYKLLGLTVNVTKTSYFPTSSTTNSDSCKH